MIRNVNVKEMPDLYRETVTYPYAPTTSATVAKFTAPKSGRLKQLTAMVAVAGTAGNSTDLKETLKLNKCGVTGAVSAVAISNEVSLVDINLTPDLLLAAGTEVKLLGLSGNRLVKGEVIDLAWTETGTIGTATRATFTILSMEFEADTNVSATVL